MIEALQYFHFLRPVWLLAVVPLLSLWLLSRASLRATPRPANGIAPHLAHALRVGGGEHKRLMPVDGVVLVGLLLMLAAAGPAWTRQPNPLIAETAPMVVALKVTKSMENADLAPSRLDRARFKVEDLISIRAGARTALVAYAGTAHRVAPLTEDPNILRPLMAGLTPKVMPVEGADASAALFVAIDEIARADLPGAVLFVLDDFTPGDVEAFNADPDRPHVVFLVAAPDAVSLPQLAQVQNATVVRITADDSDLAQIERRLKSVQAAALAGDERLKWNDRGWLLLWPAVVLSLLWFRRGWTMRWAVAGLALLTLMMPGSVRAEGWADWFLTPDQQGQIAYNNKQFSRAGELFADPYRAAHAKYRAGEYEEAAEGFATLDTAEAAFAEGMSRIRFRQYRPAIRAFELALERQPDFPAAEANLKLARVIVDYVEETREESDTGENTGLGADEIVFDNESGRGADTQIEAPKEDAVPLTSDQWLQSIDTEMGDFLRSRFLLENAVQGTSAPGDATSEAGQ